MDVPMLADTKPSSANAHESGEATDEALVSAVRAGRTGEFAELVRRYQSDVMRIVAALLYDRSATDDLVHDVFVHAYRGLETFDAGRDFGPWVRTIARNAVREHLRRAVRYRKRLADYGDVLAAGAGDDLLAGETMERLQRLLDGCLRRMPERSAAAVKLHYLGGLDTAAVAVELGTSPGAIRNLLCRTRVALRHCMERELATQ